MPEKQSKRCFIKEFSLYLLIKLTAMKNILFSLAILISLGNSYNKIPLKTPEMEKHFSEVEIQGLSSIVSFVDSIVKAGNPHADINSAYYAFFDNIKKTGENALASEIKYPFLGTLDKQLLNKIWITDFDAPYSFLRPVVKELDEHSVYFHYIKDLGKLNPFYAEFFETCTMAGGLAPSSYATFIVNIRNFDFTDCNNRLFAAVLILTPDV
jgi:hypothetical protein